MTPYPPPFTVFTRIQYTYSHREGGKGGELTREGLEVQQFTKPVKNTNMSPVKTTYRVWSLQLISPWVAALVDDSPKHLQRGVAVCDYAGIQIRLRFEFKHIKPLKIKHKNRKFTSNYSTSSVLLCLFNNEPFRATLFTFSFCSVKAYLFNCMVALLYMYACTRTAAAWMDE